jgi:hypothetical protein
MAPELLSYTHSILNPLIKLAAIVLFILAVYYFYRCRLLYGGKLKVIATLFTMGGIVGVLASAFRYAGDYFESWKWGETIFFLALAIITLVVAYLVRIKFKNANTLFVSGFREERK